VLQREIYSELLDWYNDEKKKALLICGARQIGKTYIVREFANEKYDVFVEFNFLEDIKAREIFDGDLDVDTLIPKITAYGEKALIPGKTLIFFDEIQECPNARTAIKFLVEDGRFDYIESGSLLGVNYKLIESYPVGFEKRLYMYPLTFKEFCINQGVQEETFDLLEKSIHSKKPIDHFIHDLFIKHFTYYVIVGGMPEVVATFFDTRDLAKVLSIQKEIVILYRDDISKYAGKDRLKILEIFDSIPSQLNDSNRRFMLNRLSANARLNRYEDSFLWLKDAGVGLPYYNLDHPMIPLKLNEKRNLFKLYLSDSGLLCAMSLKNIQYDLLNGDFSINMGSILENVFATQLKANEYDSYYYHDKKVGEIDFVIQEDNHLIAIEIKSGSNYKSHSALNNVLEKYSDVKEGIVFCKDNVLVEGNVTYLPWYMIMFLKPVNKLEGLIVDLYDFSKLEEEIKNRKKK